jgi:hypothetical protein
VAMMVASKTSTQSAATRVFAIGVLLEGRPPPDSQDRRCSALRPYACRETICDVCFQACNNS